MTTMMVTGLSALSSHWRCWNAKQMKLPMLMVIGFPDCVLVSAVELWVSLVSAMDAQTEEVWLGECVACSGPETMWVCRHRAG